MKRVRMNTMNSFLFLLGVLICWHVAIGISDCSEPVFSKNTALSGKIYIDPKGFFKIRPPANSNVQEYMDDPRGKVKFICAENKNTNLLVGGQASGFASFEELMNNSISQAERIKSKYSAFSTSTTTEKISFDNAPAVRGTVFLPGQFRQVSFEFIRGNTYFNLGYGAPYDLYEKYLEAAMASIYSFEPIFRDMTRQDVIHHLVASKLRVAILSIQMGQIEWAIRAINEGLEIAPDNKDLIELKRQIEKK